MKAQRCWITCLYLYREKVIEAELNAVSLDPELACLAMKVDGRGRCWMEPEKAHVPGSTREVAVSQTRGSGRSGAFEIQIRSRQSSQNSLMVPHVT